MKKYVVVVRAPAFVTSVLMSAYQRLTGRVLATDNMHVSLTYPFYLHEGYNEAWLKARVLAIDFETIGAWLANPGVFSQEKKVLYVLVEPKDLFETLHRKVTATLRGGIVFDVSVYKNGDLPPYLPHISLDYDFDGDSYTLEALRDDRVDGYFDVDELSIFGYDETSFEILL